LVGSVTKGINRFVNAFLKVWSDKSGPSEDI